MPTLKKKSNPPPKKIPTGLYKYGNNWPMNTPRCSGTEPSTLQPIYGSLGCKGLNLALDWSECLASRPGCFTSGEKNLVTIKLAVRRASKWSCRFREEENPSVSARNRSLGRPGPSLVNISITLAQFTCRKKIN